MTALQTILDRFRSNAATHREGGTYFEELTVQYLRNEPYYRDLYQSVLPYAEWAKRRGLDKRDTGIDLVAESAGTGEVHAIQCKLCADDYTVQKADIDSFFTASGKHPFTHRIIVTTTNRWSEHAEDALRDQKTPVTKIDLTALENSQIDWARFVPKAAPSLRPKKSLRPHQRDAVAQVLTGLEMFDRGKLIMACGTGKTSPASSSPRRWPARAFVSDGASARGASTIGCQTTSDSSGTRMTCQPCCPKALRKPEVVVMCLAQTSSIGDSGERAGTRRGGSCAAAATAAACRAWTASARDASNVITSG